MIGPYKTEDEMLEAILYWQKRALKAEREVEDSLDYEGHLLSECVKYKIAFEELEDHYEILDDFYLQELERVEYLSDAVLMERRAFEELEAMYNNAAVDRDYYKQMYLDKCKEVEVIIEQASFITGADE